LKLQILSLSPLVKEGILASGNNSETGNKNMKLAEDKI
jgi:hypothetical protein